MKRLTNLKFMVMAMFVAMLSMSLTACSDDDDDYEGSNYAESVVGTWQYGTVNLKYIHLYIFKPNGTGEEKEIHYNEHGQETSNNHETISYTYVYNKESGFGKLSINREKKTTHYKVQRFVDKLHIYTNDNSYNEYIKK